jgi:hypothetical protein
MNQSIITNKYPTSTTYTIKTNSLSTIILFLPRYFLASPIGFPACQASIVIGGISTWLVVAKLTLTSLLTTPILCKKLTDLGWFLLLGLFNHGLSSLCIVVRLLVLLPITATTTIIIFLVPFHIHGPREATLRLIVTFFTAEEEVFTQST